jgi:tRNA:m4X modification enzyme
LARYIHEALDRKGPDAIVLVDRFNSRKKADSYIRCSTTVDLERCLVDIKDLDLGKVHTLKKHSGKPIIVIGKHVCGAATDLTIRCLIHAVECGLPIKAILIALCCHHRCDWTEYCHRKWMERHHITGTRFEMMRLMSSWAICGHRQSHNHMRDAHSNIDEDSLLANCYNSKLKVDEKEILGYTCKRIIDQGRLEYLRENGFTVELVHYVDREVSPENIALFARR